jgi:hypothetical protein
MFSADHRWLMYLGPVLALLVLWHVAVNVSGSLIFPTPWQVASVGPAAMSAARSRLAWPASSHAPADMTWFTICWTSGRSVSISSCRTVRTQHT